MTTAIKSNMSLAPAYTHQVYDKGLPPIHTRPYFTSQLPLCFATRPYLDVYQPFGGHPFIFPPITHHGTLPVQDMFPYDKYVAARNAFVHQQEPKPNHSYIALIAMAIMNSPEKKLILSGIYQYILDNYPYFRTRGPGWRNSIRHNLSLNDCFVKISRSANGKGHFWAIHPANYYDFSKGDFRRRRAQRQVRKHMGLLTEEEEDETPYASPEHSVQSEDIKINLNQPTTPVPYICSSRMFPQSGDTTYDNYCKVLNIRNADSKIRKKRMFDIDSLLAPNDVYVTNADEETSCKKLKLSTNETELIESTTKHQELAIKEEDCQVNIKIEIE